MNNEALKKHLTQKVQAIYGSVVDIKVDDQTIVLHGQLDTWQDIIHACNLCVDKKKQRHVVNNLTLKGVTIPPMRLPKQRDRTLNGATPDVLIIGGGISGASIARELSRWKLTILLVDKEADLAMQASGRNDGEVHPGVDLRKGSVKQHYIVQGNHMYSQICKELGVPFQRKGQVVGFDKRSLYPIVKCYAWYRRNVCKITDTKVIDPKKLLQLEPNLNHKFKFALYNPSAGCVCPYGLTIAYAENAVENGAQVSLNTAVTKMLVKNHKILRVTTNRGTIYPKLVINAAGTFAEDVSKMAHDHFYSIHPRKGTNSILDKKTGPLITSIASIKLSKKTEQHTKGGGILHTVHDNLLVGPNAIETYEKENFSTEQACIDGVFQKQTLTSPKLSKKDIITYFTGVRAATFEEDFVIEKGHNTNNLIHCAGIQSPGLTTAPAVAIDVANMVVEELSKGQIVEKNTTFNPNRKVKPILRNLSQEERNRIILSNPDYGEIVCRCEEISKGEILDALNSCICVPTIDGIKKRVRPGMGRCQGGFCMPLVTKIISEYMQIPLHEVRKSNTQSMITFGETKGVGE